MHMVLLHTHTHGMDLSPLLHDIKWHLRAADICLSRAQWWIGNAAEDGKAATVFARLRVPAPDGSGSVDDHGVHAFVVPLRDASGQCLPGVEIQDCGYKVSCLHWLISPRSLVISTMHLVSCSASAELCGSSGHLRVPDHTLCCLCRSA